MSDKVAEAITILSEELGLFTLSVWAPGASDDGDAEVQAIFFAKDESALMAAAVDCVTRGEPAS